MGCSLFIIVSANIDSELSILGYSGVGWTHFEGAPILTQWDKPGIIAPFSGQTRVI